MASDAKKLQPIIIKRVKKGGHAAHGGAWKIAYADFVTAMMAFFLLMWLLGSTTEGDKKGISDYFQLAAQGGHGGRQRRRRQQQHPARRRQRPDPMVRPGPSRRQRTAPTKAKERQEASTRSKPPSRTPNGWPP